VGNFLRHLEREREVSGRAPGPRPHRPRVRGGVEGGVHFDGAKCSRVRRKKFGSPRPGRIKRPHPRRIVPSLRPDANPHSCEMLRGTRRACSSLTSEAAARPCTERRWKTPDVLNEELVSDGQWLRQLLNRNRDLYTVGPIAASGSKVRTIIEGYDIRHRRLVHPQVKLLVGEILDEDDLRGVVLRHAVHAFG